MVNSINQSFQASGITVTQTEPKDNKNIGTLTWTREINGNTEERNVEYADLSKPENCLYKFFVINVLELFGRVKTVEISKGDEVIRARVWTDDLTKLQEIGVIPAKVTYNFKQILNRTQEQTTQQNSLILEWGQQFGLLLQQKDGVINIKEFKELKNPQYGIPKTKLDGTPNLNLEEILLVFKKDTAIQVSFEDMKKLLTSEGTSINCKKIEPNTSIPDVHYISIEGTLTLVENKTATGKNLTQVQQCSL